MNSTPKIPCSQCGSENTELRNTPPGKGFLQDLKEHILSMSSLPGHLSGGQKFVVCKACGHVSCIFIR